MKLRLPDEIKIFCDIDRGITLPVSRSISHNDINLSMEIKDSKLQISVSAESTPLFHLRFRWSFTEGESRRGVRIMGDTWERTYGELEWRGIIPQRFMPWYMLVSNGSDTNTDYRGRFTEGFGVSVQPSSVCSWQYDTHGVTLWMDVRCGGDGVLLNGRTLHVCDVLMEEYRDMSAFDAGRLFCSAMCPSPLIPEKKIYGSNNWYYAVGNSSHEQILTDARLISSLTEGIENRPYMVIDDGWQRNPCDGPWDAGSDKFPDMARLAKEITEAGAVPGLWVRYLSDKAGETPNAEGLHIPGRPEILDPSLPGVIEKVKEDTKRFVDWGYKLIKHDFTTVDIFGVYGLDRHTYLSENGWSFSDRTRTTAEIVLDLYRAIKESAGDDCIIIGCCTPSHLSAGLVHLYRTGHDTSGRYFERTRICGVNALAFRMIQNGTFYVCDADCSSHTGRIDWTLNREWLRAVGESGTALFISTDPSKTGDDQIRDMKEALAKNALQEDSMIPLDWMENTAPERYLVNGEEKVYNWYTSGGTERFIPPADPEY